MTQHPGKFLMDSFFDRAPDQGFQLVQAQGYVDLWGCTAHDAPPSRRLETCSHLTHNGCYICRDLLVAVGGVSLCQARRQLVKLAQSIPQSRGEADPRRIAGDGDRCQRRQTLRAVRWWWYSLALTLPPRTTGAATPSLSRGIAAGRRRSAAVRPKRICPPPPGSPPGLLQPGWPTSAFPPVKGVCALFTSAPAGPDARDRRPANVARRDDLRSRLMSQGTGTRRSPGPLRPGSAALRRPDRGLCRHGGGG